MTKFIKRLEKQSKMQIVHRRNKGWFFKLPMEQLIKIGCNKVDTVRNLSRVKHEMYKAYKA